MIILGVETATDILGVALTEDNTLISEYRSNIRRAHAERIIGTLEKVLSDRNLSLQEVDGIAVSIGPGSFTALRIGLSAVKGISYATNIPVVAINTLDALAYQAHFWREQICPLIFAQANEVYTARYQFSGFELERKGDYQLITVEELNSFLEDNTLILNSGVKNLESFVSSERITIAPKDMSMLNGLTIAQLGYSRFKEGHTENIDTLEPFYLKEFIAKRKSEHR